MEYAIVKVDDFTLSITSLARSEELNHTLSMVKEFPNIQVILNGGDLDLYRDVIVQHKDHVRFIINKRNLGIAAAWNEGVIYSRTRYVVLSSDDITYTQGWYDSLIDTINSKRAPLQVSLSYPFSYSCFCVDKKLIAIQGWFDHNFVRAYYEDEDWYLRFRERLALHNNPIPSEEIIPHLKSVIRHPHKTAPWNPIPNRLYFYWKWQRQKRFDDTCLHSRELQPFRRRLREPDWPIMEKIREAYGNGDYGEKPWIYSPPRWEIRNVDRYLNNRLAVWIGKRLSHVSRNKGKD